MFFSFSAFFVFGRQICELPIHTLLSHIPVEEDPNTLLSRTAVHLEDLLQDPPSKAAAANTPYIFAHAPFVSAKEPHISAEESCMSAGEPAVVTDIEAAVARRKEAASSDVGMQTSHWCMGAYISDLIKITQVCECVCVCICVCVPVCARAGGGRTGRVGGREGEREEDIMMKTAYFKRNKVIFVLTVLLWARAFAS